MLRRLGVVAIARGTRFTTLRACRVRHATPERPRAGRGSPGRPRAGARRPPPRSISLYRGGSQIIPVGWHPVNQLRWWEEDREREDALGARIRRGGLRVSIHPGQLAVLSSPAPTVIEAALLAVQRDTTAPRGSPPPG